MKVHFISIGYTIDMFKDAFKEGVDKIVAIHSDKYDKNRVDPVIESLKIYVSDTKLEIIDSTEFENKVLSVIDIINKNSNKYDDIYVNISGGERDISNALLYSSFFFKNIVNIIISTKDDSGKFNMELLTNCIKSSELRKTQKEILNIIGKEDKGLKVVEILPKMNNNTSSSLIFQHLKKLTDNGIIEFNSESKKYKISKIGKVMYNVIQ